MILLLYNALLLRGRGFDGRPVRFCKGQENLSKRNERDPNRLGCTFRRNFGRGVDCKKGERTGRMAGAQATHRCPTNDWTMNHRTRREGHCSAHHRNTARSECSRASTVNSTIWKQAGCSSATEEVG
jgi:hypothetical protein